mgnify:CR=1 FL=1
MGPVRLWLNQVGTRGSWLQVRLDNGPQNRLGLGVLVHVERPGAPSLISRVRTDGSYLPRRTRRRTSVSASGANR